MLISSLIDFMGGKWWLQISSLDDILFTIIFFIIGLIVMTIVFYVAGVIVVGKRRALLRDAFVISLLGTVVSNICLLLFPMEIQLIGLIVSFIAWLLLIRYYYETGWLGALAVAILAVIIYVVVLVLLAFLAMLLGFTFVLFGWLELFLVL